MRKIFQITLLFLQCTLAASCLENVSKFGEAGQSTTSNLNSSFLHIESFISSSTGAYSGELIRNISQGSTLTSSNNGVLKISPNSSITINIPSYLRLPNYIGEIQLIYGLELDNDEPLAFKIENANSAKIAEGEILQDSYYGYQTTTLQIDYLGTSSIKITNTSATEDLRLNGYLNFYPIESKVNNGVYIADLRSGSSRVGLTTTASQIGWVGAISTPNNFWNDGSLFFNLSDIISEMTNPVVEFNFGRDDYKDLTLNLRNDIGTIIASYSSDYYYNEDTGHRLIVPLDTYKTSAFFQLEIDSFGYVNPFVKIYDAAVVNTHSVMIDTRPTSSAFVTSTGSFSYTSLNNASPSLWESVLASPIGTVQFNIPPIVSGYQNAVLELSVISRDNNDVIDLEIRDQDDALVALIHYDPPDEMLESVYVNQIPLGSAKNATLLKIIKLNGSAGAFDSNIRIFNGLTSSN